SASRSVATRHRSHTLAPEHLGERASVATLVIGIGGVALLITAASIIVAGLTIGSRYADSTPPNIGQLGIGQVIGGIGLLILAMGLVAAAAAVFLDVRGSRRTAAGVAALTAILMAVAIVVVMTVGGGDRLLAIALLVGVVMFGASSVLLLRTPRPESAA
ncbi:MAG: hypothetical protein ABI622_02770, partial [Chloroflexota bacterium]